MTDIVERLREEFLPAILHGDEQHQQWLKDAVEAFIAGTPIPKPRGKGSADIIEAQRVAWADFRSLANAAVQSGGNHPALREKFNKLDTLLTDKTT